MVRVVDHPLVKVHVTRLRDRATPPEDFRRHLAAVTRLLAFVALGDFPVVAERVATPLETAEGWRLAQPPVLVPVLRAGLGMVEAFLDVVPQAAVSHLGLYRDHATRQPVRYYANFPATLAERPIILLDPMLATGGSAVDALDFLKAQGATQLRLVNVIAAPEGIASVEAAHPDVPVYAAQIDAGLNDDAYIVPGLGDAGDRQFGTV
jgi:uracil phosphoribosyltransferase